MILQIINFIQRNCLFSILLCGLGCMVYFLVKEICRSRPDKLPESYPLENSFKLIQNYDRINEFFYDEYLKNPETYSINIIGMEWIIPTYNIANITHILKNVDKYGKGPGFALHFKELLGDGIFSSDGPVWYKHRKTSSHLFNLSIFKNSVLDTFNKHGDDVVEIIKAKAGLAFDVQDLFYRFTLESIGEIAFGKSLDLLHKESVPFAEAFDYCQGICNESMFDPFGIIKRYVTPEGWKFFKCIRLLDDFAYGIVRERREEFRQEEERRKNGEIEPSDSTWRKRNDILSLYMRRENTDEEELSDKVLRDVVMSFVIAGRDTTANALSWSVFRLCEGMHFQERIVEEIRGVLREKNQDCTATGFRWTYEILQELKYLEAFVMEVLRLHPSIPREGKYALEDDVLPDGTKVSKGMLVAFHPYVMGRSEKLWGLDCLEFKPERFLNVSKPSPFVFTAFQAGPRICLGQNLAMLELKYMLARLLVSFRLKLMQDIATVTYQTTVSLPVKGGLSISASPRSM